MLIVHSKELPVVDACNFLRLLIDWVISTDIAESEDPI